MGERRLDRILILVYLVVVPLLVVGILVLVLVQTGRSRDEAKATATAAKEAALQTCVHVNRRDRLLSQIVTLGVSLTKSLNETLTQEQEQTIAKIEKLTGALKPQDCTLSQ